MLVFVSSLLLPGALVQPPAPRLSSHIRSGRAPLASFDKFLASIGPAEIRAGEERIRAMAS